MTRAGGSMSMPRLDDDTAVDVVVARLKAVFAGWRRDTPVAQMRADWDALFDAPVDAAVTPVEVAGVGCCRVTAPGVRNDRTIVYLHGGGLQLGSTRSHRELMARLSAAAGVAVLGIDYRLAPEHRQPQALADVLLVLDWLRRQGIGGPTLALAGDSAGGGLVLSALLALQAQAQPTPLAAAVWLMSPWTDMTASGASYQTRSASDPLHQRNMLLALARNCLAPQQDAADPLASPLLADAAQLGTLPPLLVQVGDRETLLSDSQNLVEKVCAAGGVASCQVWPGMIHVFQQFPSELAAARAAIEAGGAFLAGHLFKTPS